MILKSTGIVPMNDGKYFGRITGSLVDASVILFDDVFSTTSFHVEEEVMGIDIPVVIVVEDALADVYVED